MVVVWLIKISGVLCANFTYFISVQSSPLLLRLYVVLYMYSSLDLDQLERT